MTARAVSLPPTRGLGAKSRRGMRRLENPRWPSEPARLCLACGVLYYAPWPERCELCAGALDDQQRVLPSRTGSTAGSTGPTPVGPTGAAAGAGARARAGDGGSGPQDATRATARAITEE